MAVIGVCLVCAFIFFQASENDLEIETNSQNITPNYQTIVLKDSKDTLIPIEVDLGVEGESDTLFRNMLFLMQSNEYEDLGLFPLLSGDLEVNAMEIDGTSLTFDFNDSLYASNNEDALDILEGLTYTFCRDGIENIKFKIDGEYITHIPNSTIPVSSATNMLGINNFDSDSLHIHRTIPVLVYNQQTINERTYYVPVTTRVEADCTDFSNQVSLLLDKINYQEPITIAQEVDIEEGNLKVSLSPNILMDNESIDQTLYQQLMKSLESIQGVEEVTLYVDNQEIQSTVDVSNRINNRIRL